MNEENINAAVTAALDAIAKTNPDWSSALQKGGLVKGCVLSARLCDIVFLKLYGCFSLPHRGLINARHDIGWFCRKL